MVLMGRDFLIGTSICLINFLGSLQGYNCICKCVGQWRLFCTLDDELRTFCHGSYICWDVSSVVEAAVVN